jgi:hypothetical protein
MEGRKEGRIRSEEGNEARKEMNQGRKEMNQERKEARRWKEGKERKDGPLLHHYPPSSTINHASSSSPATLSLSSLLCPLPSFHDKENPGFDYSRPHYDLDSKAWRFKTSPRELDWVDGTGTSTADQNKGYSMCIHILCATIHTHT